jgi:Tol biopolymer transport system component
MIFRFVGLTMALAAGVLLPARARAQTPWTIYVMNADGGEVRKITSDNHFYGSPAWSHDGKKLVYDGGATELDFSGSRIFVHALGDEKALDVGPGNCPSLSPDDLQIAFFVPTYSSSGAKPGVWVMNADGKNREWISDGERPRWSPDGDKLVFTSSHEGFPSVYVYDTISLETIRVLDRGYDQIIGAAFSPDSSQLVFVGYKGGNIFNSANGEVAVVNAQVGAKANAVCKGRVGWHPDWSPQGKKLLFRIQESTMERLQVLDLETDGKPVAIPNQFGSRNSDGVWSPDGKQIVFSSDRA